jgi:hypothetical protein
LAQLRRDIDGSVHRSVHGHVGWRSTGEVWQPGARAVIALAMAVERAEVKPEPVELLGWL